MTSPNEMQAAAIELMLDGKEPVTKMDFCKVANFFAANLAGGMELAAMPLLGLIMGWPLSKEEILEITKFQMDLKKKEKRA